MVTVGSALQVVEVVVAGAAGRAHVGGAGEALVLIHGDWGGAAAHWAPVWERLASDFRVVAPELPGLSRWAPGPGLGSVAAYARWVAGVLERHAPGPAWLVGNSFGATVAWRLAAELGPRCRGVVLVNGFPMPRTPALLAFLGRFSAPRALLREAWRRTSFTPAALERAFVDSARAPAELAAAVRDPDPRHLAAFTDLLVAGDPGPAPAVPTLLLWGARDRLPRSTADDARRIARRLPGAALELVADAGHLPQVEQPDAFVEALTRFAGARRAATAARADA